MPEKQHHTTISLVIPAFNEATHIKACLDSVSRQSVMPDEVIIIDNNSSDKTVEISRKYHFVKILNEEQQGIVFARNRGFNEAKGQLIARIDADTVLPDNWVEYITAYYQDETNINTAWTGGGNFHNVRLPRLVNFAYELLAFRLNALLAGHVTLWGSNMALPNSIWKNIRPKLCNRVDIHEDLDLAIHIHDSGYKIFFDNKVKVAATLKRVNNNRAQLWGYLQWWPRTLRIHKRWTWPIVWFFGAFLLYIATFVLLISDKLANILGKPAIKDA